MDTRDTAFLPLPVEHSEATRFLPLTGRYDRAAAIELQNKWRVLGEELGYFGPTVWIVSPGFTLKKSAPRVGICFEDFGFLQPLDFADEPTIDCLVFWIPRLLAGSVGHDMRYQAALRLGERNGRNLPHHHLQLFGGAPLLAGLMLAHRLREPKAFERVWFRTDTKLADGRRLILGDCIETGLDCRHDWSDDARYQDLGTFPLAIETRGFVPLGLSAPS